MVTTFSGSGPTQSEVTQRISTWNGDESTLGAPCEDPEYGAGDPERVLELVASGGYKSPHVGEAREQNETITQVNYIPAQRILSNHRVTHSTDSYSSFN